MVEYCTAVAQLKNFIQKLFNGCFSYSSYSTAQFCASVQLQNFMQHYFKCRISYSCPTSKFHALFQLLNFTQQSNGRIWYSSCSTDEFHTEFIQRLIFIQQLFNWGISYRSCSMAVFHSEIIKLLNFMPQFNCKISCIISTAEFHKAYQWQNIIQQLFNRWIYYRNCPTADFQIYAGITFVLKVVERILFGSQVGWPCSFSVESFTFTYFRCIT